MVESFVQQMPGTISKFKEHLEKMLKWLLDVSLAWAFKYGIFYVHKSDLTVVAGVLRLLNTYLNIYREKEGFEVRVPKDDTMKDLLSNFALFSVVWGVGGALEEKTRKGYSELVLKLITASADIPEAFGIKAEVHTHTNNFIF